MIIIIPSSPYPVCIKYRLLAQIFWAKQQISLEIIIAFCGSHFHRKMKSAYKSPLKNSLSCWRVFMLFLSLLYWVQGSVHLFSFIFFSYFVRICSLTGILKLLDRNKALKLCRVVFAPLVYIKFVLNQSKA